MQILSVVILFPKRGSNGTLQIKTRNQAEFNSKVNLFFVKKKKIFDYDIGAIYF